jgi:hypothetical protein
MTLSRLASVGLMATALGCTPETPESPDAYAPYGFCELREPQYYYGGREDGPFSEEPEALFEDDSKHPLDQGVLDKLTSNFLTAANEQLAKVKEAGGYCNLPEQSGPLPSTCLASNFCFTPDTRLGDELMLKIYSRDQWIESKHPEWQGRIRWTANLGRSECAVVDNFTSGDLREIDRFTYESTGFLTNAAERLSSVASNWNSVCAEAQGGRFHGLLEQDKYAGAKVLISRGRALKNMIGEREFDELAQKWHGRYVPNEEWTGKLSQEQEAYMLGSGWFAKEILGWDGLWDCPVDTDVNVADAGLRRKDMAGFIYNCEEDERVPYQGMGVVVPVPVY